MLLNHITITDRLSVVTDATVHQFSWAVDESMLEMGRIDIDSIKRTLAKKGLIVKEIKEPEYVFSPKLFEYVEEKTP